MILDGFVAVSSRLYNVVYAGLMLTVKSMKIVVIFKQHVLREVGLEIHVVLHYLDDGNNWYVFP